MATKSKVPVVGVLLIGLAIWGYSQYAKLRDSLNVQFKDVGFNGSAIAVTLTVINPSDLGGTINGIVGELHYQNNLIANVNTYQVINVPAGNIPFDVTLQLTPVYGNLINAIAQIFSTNYNPNDFRFIGKVNFGGLDIPINTTIAA